MGFQILNKNNDPIKMNDLDAEAAKLWGHEVDKSSYAVPKEQGDYADTTKGRMAYLRQSNWFDVVGHMIHSPTTKTPYYKGWKEVKKNLLLMHMESSMLKEDGSVEDGMHIKDMFEYVAEDYLKPYLDLIDHWADKGYTPRRSEY